MRPSGLQPGEVQQGVRQVQQPAGVPRRHLYLLGQVSRDLRPTARQLVQRREQQRQRGAELVSEVGIELGPGPVQFGQPL